MDIEHLVRMAITIALPYVTKGGEELAKGVGKDLWELLKKPFTKEKDKALIHTLEQNPLDVKTQNIVEYKLKEFLEENPALANELEELCKRTPASTQQKINRQIIEGISNIGIQDTTNSTITINK